MRKSGVSGQNLVEVAVIFALIVGVYASMQLYLQRALNARLKAGADYVHTELVKAAPAYASAPKHYDPYYSESWQEDNTVFSAQKGYNSTGDFPNTYNDTLTRKAWMKTDVPGQND